MKKAIKHKRFVTIIALILGIFLSYHLIIWELYTFKIFNLKDGKYVGDLGRMAYQIDSLHLRTKTNDLNVTHYFASNYTNQKVDIVTLGDSFFNGGSGGKNSYIQDYIVKDTGLKVLNIINFNPKQSPITLIENMIDVGWFEKYKPKYLILESVARGLNSKFDLQEKFIVDDLNTLHSKILSPGESLFTYVPQLKIINTANYKLPYYYFGYKYSNHLYRSVYKMSLTDNFFSVKDGNKLLFLDEDIKNMESFTDEKLFEINDKINNIARKLDSLSVKLLFFVAVDKYDLYSPFIVDNKFPKNTLFERFDKLEKDYVFINTKEILLPHIQDKEQDVFYADDTHWSYKANEIISAQITKELMP